VTPQLTIFAIPKSFSGHTGIIQENALASWVRLPHVEVILIGDDQGVAAAAQRAGARHEPSIERTDLGTPLLDSAFAIAKELSDAPALCYANADIMLFEDLLSTVLAIPFGQYLGVAQRMNVDVDGPIRVNDDEARNRFIIETRATGVLEPPWASDIFVFTRATDIAIPPFAVGRPGWDNWLVWKARSVGLPVVDVTPSVLVVHQNHDYGHVPGRRGPAWQGPEADRNLELAGDPSRLWNLDRATHLVVDGRVIRARGWRYVRAWLLDVPARAPWLGRPLQVIRRAFRSFKRLFHRSG